MKRLLAFTASLAALVATYTLMATAAIPAVPANTWAPAGDLAAVRAGASATLLPDGRVLVAGGIGETGAVATAERFAPEGGTFIDAAPMQSPRANHTATLLANGTVLVVGGTDASGQATSGAELYDPAINTWLPAGSLNVARRGHTATALPDGRVLVAGGDAGAALDSTEVFDPETLQFTLAGTMSAARTQHAAAALLDGRVVLAGGNDGSAALATTDIFDPATNSVAAGPTMTAARSGLSATTLLDGTVLLAGGSDGSVELASAERLDAAGTAFSAPDNGLAIARQNHTALLLPHNNQVLIVGGLAGGSAVASAEYFTPWEGVNGAFCASAICASGYEGPAVPTTARAWAAAASLSVPAGTEVRTGPADGLALVAGGTGSRTADLFGFATVKTDKEDYAPGTTVTITGEGWLPGEWVALVLQEAPALDEHPLELVQADANGRIVSTEFVPDEHDIGIRFYLTAYGQASQAQTTFRDSRTVSSATLTANGITVPPGVLTVSPGATITAVVNVTTDNGGGNSNWRGIGWRIGTTATPTACVNTPNHDGVGAYQETFNITAPAAPGTYNVYFVAFSNDTCTQGASTALTMSNAVVVDNAAPTIASVTRLGATTTNASAVQWSITFSESVSGVDISDFATDNLGSGPTSTSITNVAGSGATYTVTADSGNGSGSLSLKIFDNDSITDIAGNPLSGAGLNGTGGSSATYTPGFTLNRSLTPTITVSNKEYDGNTSAIILSYGFTSSLTVSDDVSVTGGTATFADKIVGNGKTVTASGLALTGLAAARYVLTASTASAVANITPRAVTPAIVADGKTYDGTTSASISACTVSPTVLGDNVSCTPATVSFDSADAGMRTATATGITLTGTDAGNYALSTTTASSQAEILKASVTVTVTAANASYDGAPHGATATVTGVGGLNQAVPIDYTGLVYGSVAYQSSAAPTEAGSYTATATFSGDANHVGGSNSANFVISKAATTLTVTAADAVYDGAAHGATATVTGPNGLNEPVAIEYSGLVYGSIVYLNSSAPTDAGSYTATANYAGTGNYEASSDAKPYVISKAATTLTVTAADAVYDGAAHGATATVTGPNGLNEPVVIEYSGFVYDSIPYLNSSAPTDAGSYTATANYAGTGNYQSSTDAKPFVISKAASATVVTAGNTTYDGTPHGATAVVTGPGGLNESVAVSYTGRNATVYSSSTPPTNAGDYTATATFAGGNNHTGSTDAKDFVISKANATINVSGYTGVYDAAAHGASGTATGVGGTDLSSGLNFGATFTDVPGGNAHWTFAGGTNYNDVSGDVAITINKATAVINVVGYTGVYDGAAHGASLVSALGVGSADLSASVTLGGETFTNVPGGVATWSFANNNYVSQTGTATITINKATATINVEGYTGVYDGLAHGASGTATGVGSTDLTSGLNLGATFTDAPGGNAHWTFTGGTNYNDASGDVAIVINKANATINVSGYTGVYDAAAHGASGTATGVGSTDLTSGLNFGATFTDVPGGNAHWTFTGGTNYNDASGDVAITINKATAVINVSGYTGVYDAAPHGASLVSAVGVGNTDLSASVTLGGETFTDVPGGVATWSFANNNYVSQTGTAAIVISKADATINVAGYTGVYDGLAHGASGTATGVGSTDLTSGLNLGATFTDVPGGNAHWTFTGGTNYNDASGDVDIVISKATAVINVTGYTGAYDGAAHGASLVSAVGVGNADLSASVTLGGETFTNVPGGVATWSFANNNYVSQTGTATITINKATATINVEGYTGVYDGVAHGASGTATGIGNENLSGALNLGATFTDVPGGTANWTFTGGTNYNNASGTVAIEITPATATVSVSGYSGTYDGNAHGATGSATGVGGAPIGGLDLGASFTDAPGGVANWSFANSNYVSQGGSVNITIAKATASVSVSGYAGVYDAASHGATGTASGVGGVNLGGNLNLGASFTDVPGGTAHWTFAGGTNYNDAEGDVAIVINRATATVTVNGYSGTYDGNAHGATGSATGVGGAAIVGLDLGASFTNVPGGTANWSFSNPNYVGQNGTANIVITKAAATINVSGYTGTYDGAAHGASGTATGVNSTDLSAGLTFGAPFTDVPGGSVHWTFSGGTNYEDTSGDVPVVINKADAAITVSGYTGVFDAASHGATGSATGVGGVNLTASLTLGASFTNVPGGTANWTFTGGTNYNNATGSVAITINPATATVTVNGYTGVYDGAAHGATLAAAVGVGGANLSASVTLGGETFTNVPGGTATWSFANPNYVSQSGTAAIAITPATATIVVTGYNVTWDGFEHIATGTATGVLGEALTGLNLNGTKHTAVGTYTDAWSFTPSTANYANANGTVVDRIGGWTENGYFAPVDMTPLNSPIVWNTVKGGSTVPLKFEIFAGGVEKTTTAAVTGFAVNQVSCLAGYDDPIDTSALTTTGGTALRYDGTSGFFIQNWQTPKSPGKCYQVVMTAQDGSQITRGFFKLK